MTYSKNAFYQVFIIWSDRTDVNLWKVGLYILLHASSLVITEMHMIDTDRDVRHLVINQVLAINQLVSIVHISPIISSGHLLKTCFYCYHMPKLNAKTYDYLKGQLKSVIG